MEGSPRLELRFDGSKPSVLPLDELPKMERKGRVELPSLGWKPRAQAARPLPLKLGWHGRGRTYIALGNSQVTCQLAHMPTKNPPEWRVEKASVQKRLIIPPLKRSPALCRWISGRGRGPLMCKREHKSILSYFPGMSTPTFLAFLFELKLTGQLYQQSFEPIKRISHFHSLKSWCPRRDSNPHCIASKAIVSCRWTTRAILVRHEGFEPSLCRF